ncbi:uncharacterized protein LOC144583267 [Pogona vitticeps]
MASGGVEETGVSSGPWETLGTTAASPWGYAGLEETTPLLTMERDDFDPEEPSQVQAGPWASKSSNPFDEDWVPLYEPLLQQEKFIPNLIDVSIPLPQLNKEDKLFGLKASEALLGKGEAKNNGPSHTGAQHVGPPPQPTDAEKWMQRITEGQEVLLKQLADQQRMIIEQLKAPQGNQPSESIGLKQPIATRPPVKLQKMGPQDDPAAFLHTFERIAISAQWPKDQWALILTPYLTGLPQEIVDTLDPEDAGDYDVVRTAILNTLNLNEEAYRRKFRGLKLKPGLHPRTLAQKLRVNATRWIQPKGKTAEQVVEIVIMEQLISTLNSGARNWVIKNKPSNLEGAVTLLEDYLEAEDTWQTRSAPQGEGAKLREKMADANKQADFRGAAQTGAKKNRPDRIEYANPVGTRVPRPTVTSDPAASKQAATWNLGKEKMTACFGCGQFGHIRKYCPVTECAWAEACTGMTKGPWARSEEERTALLEGGMCVTRSPGREVMLGVPSRPRASVGTQTAPKPFPPRMLHQAVDTFDLEKGMKGLSIATQTPLVWAGRGTKVPEEGAEGEVSLRQAGKEGEWEWVSIQDPWSGKWEQVCMTRQEAEERRRNEARVRPSYWGERETREWRRKLAEEKKRVEREREEKTRWHLEELRRLGYHPDPGKPSGQQQLHPGDMQGSRRRPHY